MTPPPVDLSAWPTPVPRTRLNVYVDETGDRGFHPNSSPFFAMTALIVPEEDDWMVRYTAAGLRYIVGTEKPLHWVEHFKKKNPERRLRAAQKLAELQTSRVIHVIAPKADVRAFGGMSHGVRFYNYTARLLLERVAYAAQQWDGGERLAVVRLGAVKGMDHRETVDYLDYVRQGRCETYGVPWRLIKWPPKWLGTEYDGIQLADVHAGLLNVALTGKPDDVECAANLLLCKHRMYRKQPSGTLWGCGVKVIGTSGFITGRVWWRDWVQL